MTQEEKSLLFKDLCARLPYEIKVQCESKGGILVPVYGMTLDTELLRGFIDGTESLRPYFRPISNMTEEEKEKVCLISQDGNIEYHYGVFYRCQDYLNSIHVDYRGLIEKGLALEAPDGMYNNK